MIRRFFDPYPSQNKLPVGMGSNFAWMLILAKYLGLSRRFSKFGSGAEIWGTPRGAPPRPKNLKKNFFAKFQFFDRNGSYEVRFDRIEHH